MVPFFTSLHVFVGLFLVAGAGAVVSVASLALEWTVRKIVQRVNEL